MSKIKELEILEQRLLAPFIPEEIDIRPGATSDFGKKASPLFYVDTRAVMKRLRQVFGLGGFSVQSSTLTFGHDQKKKKGYGENAVDTVEEGLLVGCTVEINIHTDLVNITASNVGEKGLDESGYNKVTSSWSQAFKRAAQILGVGSFLYYMQHPPVAYDKTSRKITGISAPPDDLMEQALKDSGFKSLCEVTGQQVPWLTAARSMDRFGKILSVEGAKQLKEQKAE